MTFVVVGDDSVLEQVRKQLEKIVTVVRVDDVSSPGPRRARLDADQGQRDDRTSEREIRELAEIFRGRIVDVAPKQVMVEIAGQEKKIEAFIDLMRPFGIIELVRTGRIAMVRGIDRTQPRTAGGLRKAPKLRTNSNQAVADIQFIQFTTEHTECTETTNLTLSSAICHWPYLT